MTITEKILARASGRERVVPGEIVWAAVDKACIDDVQLGILERALAKLGEPKIDPERAVLVGDHYLPPSNLEQAQAVRALRRFGERHGLKHVFLKEGVKHQVLAEAGLVQPGQVLVATDSHTNTGGALGAFATALGPTEVAVAMVHGRMWFRVPESIRVEVRGSFPEYVYPKDLALYLLGRYGVDLATYRAIEFTGETVRRMSVSERMTLCNMSTEMGAKSAIVAPDEVTFAYLQSVQAAPESLESWRQWQSDADAAYAQEIVVDVRELEPLVAVPFSPGNVRPVREVAGKPVDQALIGTCTNGNLEDIGVAAAMLRGRRVHPRVQLIVTPASLGVMRAALARGWIQDLVDAGAVVTNPGCGACAGMHMGVLDAGEVRISSQNRNFRARGGHPASEIFLASPATVAASAVTGRITDPRELGFSERRMPA
ncbi:MAG TPA: 3-isopropylmalate dehydratase large subunit [Limnochordales bacterium]